jgi:hypothetical protein
MKLLGFLFVLFVMPPLGYHAVGAEPQEGLILFVCAKYRVGSAK